MFGNADRDILIEMYAKVCSMQKEIDKLKELKTIIEDDGAKYLNNDGLYSFKDYKERARASALKHRREEE